MSTMDQTTSHTINQKQKSTYSPIKPLDVDINDANSISAYSPPISFATFLNEWNSDPLAYMLCWYT